MKIWQRKVGIVLWMCFVMCFCFVFSVLEPELEDQDIDDVNDSVLDVSVTAKLKYLIIINNSNQLYCNTTAGWQPVHKLSRLMVLIYSQKKTTVCVWYTFLLDLSDLFIHFSWQFLSAKIHYYVTMDRCSEWIEYCTVNL